MPISCLCLLVFIIYLLYHFLFACHHQIYVTNGINLYSNKEVNGYSKTKFYFRSMDDNKTKVSSNPIPKEYIPTTGLLHCEETDELILCKPKLMPLKSVTLEKLEKMQNDAEKKLKEQQELEV